MRLANTTYNFVLEIDENTVTSVVCEHPAVFCELIENLRALFNEEKSCWILSERDGERIVSSKTDIIYSPFCFEINNKKVLNKVYKDINDTFNEEYFYHIQKINNEFLKLLDIVANKLSYNIEFDLECEMKDRLKLYHVALQEDYCVLLEKLTTYIRLISSVLHIRCLFLIDIKRYLTKKEILYLYQEAFYQKVSLVLIESHFEEKLSDERVLIIDRDKCIIKM